MKKLSLCVAACAVLAGSVTAHAQTAIVGAAKPVEMRVAVAGAAWSTVWTSLRVEEAGPFALVVPLPDGAYVDESSDAWFEALEVATAPRVLPPEGLNPFCPGQVNVSEPFDVAGEIGHTESLPPQALALADDAPGVASWAQSQGLTLSGPLENALASSGAKRFLCVRFTGPGGPAITATLRVSSPKGLPSLPFSITRATSASLRVSTWLVGKGRGDLLGTQPILVPAAEISWDAKARLSDYVASRDALLLPAPDGVTLESTGHPPFAETIPFANDTAAIDPIVTTYFERAATYGNAPNEAGSCASAAKPHFATDALVSPTCPRGDLAAPPTACTAAPPSPAEIDAADLACGPGADDLAIALAGASPKATWITRRTFVIAPGASGKDRAFAFGAGSMQKPIVEAGSVDVSDCYGAGGAGGTGGDTSTTTTSTTVTGTNPNNTGNNGAGGGNYGQGGYGYGGGAAGDSYGGYGGYGATDAIADVACACASTVGTADTTSDGCSGETLGSDTTTTDNCSGDGSDTAADACSSDTTSAADSCSSDTSSTSDCAVSAPGARRSPPPRLSVLTLLALGFLLPWRRRGSRTKRPG